MTYTYEEQLKHQEACGKYAMEDGNVYSMNIKAGSGGGSVMSDGLTKDPDAIKWVISQLEIHLDGFRNKLSELQTA